MARICGSRSAVCSQTDGARHLEHADLRGAVADTKKGWPAGFDAAAADIQFGADYNRQPTSLFHKGPEGGDLP
jgi:hypothetical protein